MTRIRLFLFIIAILVPSLAAAQQSMKFEEAAAMLAASCGKDIDDNCRGVNLDATRLRECLSRNQDVVSAKCKADYPTALGAIQQRITARTSLVKLCNWELNHLCGEVRDGSRQGPAMPAGIDQEGDPELQQGDQRCGVSLMRWVNGGCAASVCCSAPWRCLPCRRRRRGRNRPRRPQTSSRNLPSRPSRISTWPP